MKEKIREEQGVSGNTGNVRPGEKEKS